MGGARRRGAVIIAMLMLVLGMFATPAAAQSAETGLQALCEHVDGGTWSAETSRCTTGSTRAPLSPATYKICRNALGGELMFTIDSLPPDAMYSYFCAVPQ